MPRSGREEGCFPVRQEAQIIQSVEIRRGQGSADPPRREPRSHGGDEMAEAEGINEVGCNESERRYSEMLWMGLGDPLLVDVIIVQNSIFVKHA